MTNAKHGAACGVWILWLLTKLDSSAATDAATSQLLSNRVVKIKNAPTITLRAHERELGYQPTAGLIYHISQSAVDESSLFNRAKQNDSAGKWVATRGGKGGNGEVTGIGKGGKGDGKGSEKGMRPRGKGTTKEKIGGGGKGKGSSKMPTSPTIAPPVPRGPIKSPARPTTKAPNVIKQPIKSPARPTTNAPNVIKQPIKSPARPTTKAPTGASTANPVISGIPVVTIIPAPVEPTIVPTKLSQTVVPSVLLGPMPTITPTPTPLQIVLVEDYYISFVAPGAIREPFQTEYDEMLVRINNWFDAQFTTIYENRTDVELLGVETSNDFTLFGLNNTIPPRPEDFNIYMNFNFTAITYSATSVVPTEAEAYEIMRVSITRDFILQVVRSFTGTPFELTVEVFFGPSQLVPPLP